MKILHRQHHRYFFTKLANPNESTKLAKKLPAPIRIVNLLLFLRKLKIILRGGALCLG